MEARVRRSGAAKALCSVFALPAHLQAQVGRYNTARSYGCVSSAGCRHRHACICRERSWLGPAGRKDTCTRKTMGSQLSFLLHVSACESPACAIASPRPEPRQELLWHLILAARCTTQAVQVRSRHGCGNCWTLSGEVERLFGDLQIFGVARFALE